MKHPLLIQAEQNDRQIAFEIEEVKTGIKRLSKRLEIAKQYGSLAAYERYEFNQLVKDCLEILQGEQSCCLKK